VSEGLANLGCLVYLGNLVNLLNKRLAVNPSIPLEIPQCITMFITFAGLSGKISLEWYKIYLNKMQVDVAGANQHSECKLSGAIVCQPAPWCMCRWCHAAMLRKLLLPGMSWQESFTQPGCIVPSTHALWCV
jgi:hypothetical protein